jgi:hypothetical protein
LNDTPRTDAAMCVLHPGVQPSTWYVQAEKCREIERELAAARADAARWQWIRRKLCLTGNGDGTCAMDALNLPVRVEGWPEPGEENVKAFCDAAIDAAMAKEPK